MWFWVQPSLLLPADSNQLAALLGTVNPWGTRRVVLMEKGRSYRPEHL